MTVTGETVYHICGKQLWKTLYWNGLERVVHFSNPEDSVNNITHCPCGEALFPNDMGISIFTIEEWEYELERRKHDQLAYSAGEWKARAEAAEADAERLVYAMRRAEQTIRNLGNGALTGDYATIALNEAANIRAALAAHDAATGDKAVAYQCNDPLCDCWGDTPFRHCPGCNELYLWSKNEPTTPCLDCQSHAAAGGGANTATLQAEVDELGRRLAENHAKLKALGVAGGESGEE